MDISTWADLLNSTLAREMSRDKSCKITNEMLRLSYAFSSMLKGDSVKLDGGTKVKFDAVLQEGGVTGFVAPAETRVTKIPSLTQKGQLDWSFFEGHVAIEFYEDIVNAGEYEKVFDIYETRRQSMTLEAYGRLDSTFYDSVGNVDTLDQPNRKFPGLKYWITRMGRAVGGGASVAGISSSSFARWRNRYIGPIGNNLTTDFSHDANYTLASAADLLDAMFRMWSWTDYQSPLGENLDQVGAERKGMLNRQKILCDPKSFYAIHKLLNATRDDRTQGELYRSGPIFMGVPVKMIQDLGLGSTGMPAAAAHTSVDGVTFAEGSHADTGEVYFQNCNYFEPVVRDGMNPHVHKSEVLPEQVITKTLHSWQLTTLCRSRMRQGVIWGFDPRIAA